MPQVLVQFDDATLRAIDRVAPAAQRKRADFIRRAVKDALFQIEEERMRAAYARQPDSESDAGAWDLPEEWKP
jgi:predicted transcriptional regulator